MSKRRSGSQPLYEAQHGTEHCRAGKLCVECGGRLKGRQQRWCGQGCVDAYLIRASPTDARRHVFKRDKGVCASCGSDTDALREQIKVADKEAAKEWLAEWNRRFPAGLWRSHGYRDPSGNYERHYGPKHYTGFRAGGALNKRCRPNTYHGMAKERRIVVLRPLGLEAWWYRKTFWDMDHVVGVAEGGGDCGLNNLQTLCLLCHVHKTSSQSTQRATRPCAHPGSDEICRRCNHPWSHHDYRTRKCAHCGCERFRSAPRKIVRRPGESKADYRARALGYAVPHKESVCG